MRDYLVLAGFLLCAPADRGLAQGALRAGDRVRVYATAPDTTMRTGAFVALRADTLEARDANGAWTMPLASISALQVNRPVTRGQLASAAAVGAVAGAAAAMLMYLVSDTQARIQTCSATSPCDSDNAALRHLRLVMAVDGAVLGAVGFAWRTWRVHRDRWETVPIP